MQRGAAGRSGRSGRDSGSRTTPSDSREMPADEDAEAGTSAAAGLLGELQGDEVGVIAADDALGLDTEDPIEIHAPEGTDSPAASCRASGEGGLVPRDGLGLPVC
jgi:hypothetical protein